MELFEKQFLKDKGCDSLKRIRLNMVFIVVLIAIFITGCGADIFVREEDKILKLERLGKKELEDGKYYIKDGTSFYAPYLATQTFSSSYTASDDNRVIWMLEEEENLIPTLYEGDTIVFATSKAVPETVEVERFKDMGYTIGLMGLEEKTSGQIVQYTTDAKKTLLGTDIYNSLLNVEAMSITVAEIDGKAVRNKNFTYGGIVSGLEKNKTYLFGLYVGSYYNEMEIKADARTFVSDSLVTLDKIELTKNGYYSIKPSEDMESGYYYLKDYGIFRYIKLDKRTALLSKDINYNKNLVTRGCNTGKDVTILCKKEYLLDEENESVNFKIISKNDKAKINSIICKTPDGKEITFKKNHYKIKKATRGSYKFWINTTALQEEIEIEAVITPKFVPVEIEEVIPEVETVVPDNSDSSTTNTNTSNNTSSSSSGTSRVPAAPTYEWIMVMPEPLEETEISDTEAGN